MMNYYSKRLCFLYSIILIDRQMMWWMEHWMGQLEGISIAAFEASLAAIAGVEVVAGVRV